MTPKQAARYVRTVEAFSAGVVIEPSAAEQIKSIRTGFAIRRAERMLREAGVDRRVGERRAHERRAMADVLSRAAVRREGEPLSLWQGLT